MRDVKSASRKNKWNGSGGGRGMRESLFKREDGEGEREREKKRKKITIKETPEG